MRAIASIIAGLTLSAGFSLAEEEVIPVHTGRTPTSLPATIPGAETTNELPPFLSVPESPAIRASNLKSCRSCPNDYNPNLAYLPDSNPDCRGGRGRCGSGGDCRSPEQFWAGADFFAGLGSDIRDVRHQGIYGIKLNLGTWLTSDNSLGLDGGFFNAHDAYRDIFLGPFGTTLVDSPVTFTTGDINLRSALFSHGRYRLDGLAGYRYLSLGEQLLEGSAGGINYWKTTNSVNLGQVGAVGSYHFGPYTGEIITKLGFGTNQEIYELNGARTSSNTFAFVPEFGARFAYGMGEGARMVLGYNLIYLNDAVRPDHRSPNNYLLQGITAGLELRY
ncbi:hypothetical protein [Zavarzinella formosa]|uniref:hypothetical protein n=1 Tax=Zavarzinella formosa TaxID=360055 RepID=UPI0002E6D3BF|nr:hypothetical protein [Zavarzinella formosa]